MTFSRKTLWIGTALVAVAVLIVVLVVVYSGAGGGGGGYEPGFSRPGGEGPLDPLRPALNRPARR